MFSINKAFLAWLSFIIIFSSIRAHARGAGGHGGLAFTGASAGPNDVTYTYTGNDFTSVSGDYTTGDYVSGTITLDQSLAANDSSTDVTADVVSFSLTDGTQEITSADNFTDYDFVFSTSSSQAITQWDVEVETSYRTDIATLDLSYYIGDSADQAANNYGDNTNSPGSWTAESAPEPPCTALIGVGSAALIICVNRRRLKQIHAFIRP